MAIVIVSNNTDSTAANTKTADKVSGQYQYVGRGKFTLAALQSATGMNITCNVGGTALCDDQPVPYIGTAGTLDISAHVIASQVLPGGRVELFLRNTTAGALTMDYILLFEPM